MYFVASGVSIKGTVDQNKHLMGYRKDLIEMFAGFQDQQDVCVRFALPPQGGFKVHDHEFFAARNSFSSLVAFAESFFISSTCMGTCVPMEIPKQWAPRKKVMV